MQRIRHATRSRTAAVLLLAVAWACMSGAAAAQPAPAETRDHMAQLSGVNFTIWFEAQADEAFARRALDALERAYWRVGGVLGSYPLRIIPVVVYAAPTFHDVTRLPAWSLGGYDGTIRISRRPELDHPAELEALVTHELTHAFVENLAPRGVPAWLGEGIATALAVADSQWPERALRAASGPMSLDRFPASFGTLDAADVPRAYATSALVATQLLGDVGGAGIANLLRDLGSGVALDTALRHRTTRSVADLQGFLHGWN